MLNCHQCAYMETTPGNCHIACRYDWYNVLVDSMKEVIANPTVENVARVTENTPPESISKHAIEMGWFYFPALYDPTWGNKCNKFVERGDNRSQINYAKDAPIKVQINLIALGQYLGKLGY